MELRNTMVKPIYPQCPKDISMKTMGNRYITQKYTSQNHKTFYLSLLHLTSPSSVRPRHLIYYIRIVFNTPRQKLISTNPAISLPACNMRVNPLIHHKWTTDPPIHPHARTLGMKR